MTGPKIRPLKEESGTRVVTSALDKQDRVLAGLARKPAHELFAARDAVKVALAGIRSWDSETYQLSALLVLGSGADRRAYVTALRVAYFEFCDQPQENARAPRMIDEMVAWERRIWRERAHVSLGLQRCVALLEQELARRTTQAERRRTEDLLRKRRERT